MIIEYQCPECGEWLKTSDRTDELICSFCKTSLSVNRDADFVNGMWQDRTSLISKNSP